LLRKLIRNSLSYASIAFSFTIITYIQPTCYFTRTVWGEVLVLRQCINHFAKRTVKWSNNDVPSAIFIVFGLKDLPL